MEPIATAAGIRAAEQSWFDAHPRGDLMGRAAAAVARAAAAQLAGRESWGVLVVAGPGNNAGDALFAAAELSDLLGRRVPLWVWPVADRTHEDGLAAALGEGAVVIDAAAALLYATGVGVVLDGLSGLGGRPGLPDAALAVARAAAEASVPVVSVDLPSGLVADSARAHPSFVADVTVTFIARKLAQVAQPAASACGRVDLVDIGVEPPATDTWLVTADDLRAWYPWPGPLSDKYSRGVVGIDTGSAGYPGAALLGVGGALHAGAGMVRYVGPARDAVLAAFPSVVAPLEGADPGRVQAWVCGSGWPDADPDRLARRLADGVPTVLDAGALAALPAALPDGSLLTPHAGELARLLGVPRADVEAEPIEHARDAAARTGAHVLLKGATQYSVAPDGGVLIAEPGPAWTATAGSGDTLAGIAGTLLAAGLDPWRAGALAASLQARAAHALPGPRTPEEVATRGLPDAIVALQH
ncbi:bifunctional ADP-dependent NAD(P)H-hydrate dehydratase/NAD(P)H-hydrate epimerase [Propioniciclava coleopterorum]|uniref:ADP-dependent (S)-NAD(P)H-hydrate dehydratase n=1 Tax=Propioniciclava coleopterorum TaxID=2714937 RepID=A0A6G7Y8B7_9ACTN|nr:bifunctional ADP-dependent NAD(P)H-hydrate dehydratase/NAD(P)H-hydrate epimerase [Propioniciclava coleopterorum]QIK73020.1 bifunctional ADP-dependent NAD(P)H-hydrate dehydratase/NAD(P)H-hydrate epimerase [Propioniciclava coleopterorum]